VQTGVQQSRVQISASSGISGTSGPADEAVLNKVQKNEVEIKN
jgi:hypothetical protein